MLTRLEGGVIERERHSRDQVWSAVGRRGVGVVAGWGIR